MKYCTTNALTECTGRWLHLFQMHHHRTWRIQLNSFCIKISNRNALRRNASRLSVYHCTTHKTRIQRFPFILKRSRMQTHPYFDYYYILDFIQLHNVLDVNRKHIHTRYVHFIDSKCLNNIIIISRLNRKQQQCIQNPTQSDAMQWNPYFVKCIVLKVRLMKKVCAQVMWCCRDEYEARHQIWHFCHQRYWSHLSPYMWITMKSYFGMTQ